jgi:hypothetical protein
MGKSNEEKRQEIKDRGDRFKEENDLKEQQNIDTLNEMVDNISLDEKSDKRLFKILQIIDWYGKINKTDEIEKIFRKRLRVFKGDLTHFRII